MATDPYSKHASGITESGDDWFSITPGAADFATLTRAILVPGDAASGDTATITSKDGTSITVYVAAGQVIPIRARKVTAASLSGTGTLVGIV